MPQLPRSERRDHILKVAGRVFLDEGFAGASMGDIAKAGAGSKGTLYTYFASKEEMFEEFIVSEIRKRANVTFDLPAGCDDPASVLHDLGIRYLRLITDPIVSSLLRLVIAESKRFPKIGKVFNNAGPIAARIKLADFISKCSSAGSLDATGVDPELAADQFLRLCQAGFMHEFITNQREAPAAAEMERIVQSAVIVFMASYGAGNSRSRSSPS